MANYHREQQPPQSFQEFPEFQEAGFDSGDIHRFAKLHLNSTPPCHHYHDFTGAPTTTTTSDVRVRSLEKCTSCGPVKRQSPSSFSSLQEPSAKRAALCHPASAVNASDENLKDSLGSGKLPLDNAAASPALVPPISSETRQTALYRSHSDITSYMGTQETRETDANVQVLNSQSGEISNINSVSPSPSPVVGMPPLPPALHRSLSEPIPSASQPVADSTPSRAPSAGRTFVPSPSSDQESSNSKRLRRIKERMKQMSQWVEKVASEEDENEDTCSETDNACDKNSMEMSENDKPGTRPDLEAVRVEERGGNLIIHFKCPCEKGYEIFLSGNKCYYRLT